MLVGWPLGNGFRGGHEGFRRPRASLPGKQDLPLRVKVHGPSIDLGLGKRQSPPPLPHFPLRSAIVWLNAAVPPLGTERFFHSVDFACLARRTIWPTW